MGHSSSRLTEEREGERERRGSVAIWAQAACSGAGFPLLADATPTQHGRAGRRSQPPFLSPTRLQPLGVHGGGGWTSSLCHVCEFTFFYSQQMSHGALREVCGSPARQSSTPLQTFSRTQPWPSCAWTSCTATLHARRRVGIAVSLHALQATMAQRRLGVSDRAPAALVPADVGRLFLFWLRQLRAQYVDWFVCGIEAAPRYVHGRDPLGHTGFAGVRYVVVQRALLSTSRCTRTSSLSPIQPARGTRTRSLSSSSPSFLHRCTVMSSAEAVLFFVFRGRDSGGIRVDVCSYDDSTKNGAYSRPNQ